MKRKGTIKKSRFAVFIMVACMLACVGCGEEKGASGNKDGGNSNGKTAEPGKMDSNVEDGKQTFEDLGGMEIKIGDWFTKEMEPVTQYEEATKEYRDQIMDQYHFKISREMVGAWQDMPELFATSVLNNEPIAHIVYLYQTQIARPLQSGFLYDLSSLRAFDFEEEKWNRTVSELMTVDGRVYGMQTEQEPRGGIFFNKRLFQESGIDPEEPYDLQAKGEWTWDVFEEYCKKLTRDTDKDGTIDVYALGSFSKDHYKMCVASNGTKFVDKVDGKYVNVTDDPAWMEAVQWGTALIEKGYVMKKPNEGVNWDWFTSAFRDAEVAMQISEVYQVGTWSDSMDDDYGFVMMPAGPKGKMVTCPMDNVIVIPSCIEKEEAEKIAFAYDLYTETTPGYEATETWKDHYSQLFTDARAVDETLEMMRMEEHQVIDYLPLIYGMDYGDFTYPVYALDKTPAQQLEIKTPEWNAKIEDMNGKMISE